MNSEEETMAGETWGTVAAEVELDDNPRTVGPFAAVIAEYQRHLDKCVRHNKQHPKNMRAALYYAKAVVELGRINGI